MPRRDDTITLRHMLDYAQKACRMVAGRPRRDLDTDEMLCLALTRAIEVIGEAASRVTSERRQKHPSIPWSQIVSARNRLIHGYDMINYDILWDIVSLDLPPLIEQLENILSHEPKE